MFMKEVLNAEALFPGRFLSGHPVLREDKCKGAPGGQKAEA